MINLGPLDWTLLIGVVLLSWIVGLRWRAKKSTWRGYYLANASMPGTNVAATYFGANLTFTTIFLILSYEGYHRGPVAFSVPVFWFLGSVLFTAFYPRIKIYLIKGMTLHQALGEAYCSKSLQRWASLWTIMAFVGTVGLEFYGGVLLLQWAGASSVTATTIGIGFAFICTAMTVTGGFRGLAAADIALDLFAFAAAVILFVWAAKPAWLAVSAEPVLPLPTLSDSIIFVAGMGVIFLPFQFCVLDSWQRCAAWQKSST